MRFSRVPFITALLTAIALSACGSTSSSTPGAQTASVGPQAVVPQVRTISDNQKLLYIPASSTAATTTGTPPIINAWVSLSATANGTPCVNCVGNPPAQNTLGIAYPQPYLPHNGLYEITYTFYNVSEGNAMCTLVLSLVQNGVSVVHFSTSVKLSGNGGYVYFVGGTLPSTAAAGAATATGVVHCNGYALKAAMQHVILT